MDDWKKRRREKQKLQPTKKGELGDQENDAETSMFRDKRRIGRFENSAYCDNSYFASNPVENQTFSIDSNEYSRNNIKKMYN